MQGGNRERNIANIFNWIVFYKIWPDLTIYIPGCEIRWIHRTSSSSKSETHNVDVDFKCRFTRSDLTLPVDNPERVHFQALEKFLENL